MPRARCDGREGTWLLPITDRSGGIVLPLFVFAQKRAQQGQRNERSRPPLPSDLAKAVEGYQEHLQNGGGPALTQEQVRGGASFCFVPGSCSPRSRCVRAGCCRLSLIILMSPPAPRVRTVRRV